MTKNTRLEDYAPPKIEHAERLPEKLSDLLDLALGDLDVIEKDDRYSINMGTWHEPATLGDQSVCQVCLAGAVLARTLEIGPDIEVVPSMILGFAASVAHKMHALDCLRGGNVMGAILSMNPRATLTEAQQELVRKYNFLPSPHLVAKYELSPARWRMDMQKLLHELREAGL